MSVIHRVKGLFKCTCYFRLKCESRRFNCNDAEVNYIRSDPFALSFVNEPSKLLHEFINREDVYNASLENGICEAELTPMLSSFAEFYTTHWSDTMEMRVILSDIEREHKHITDLLPNFLRFAYSHRSSKESLVKTRSLIEDFVKNYHSDYFRDARHIKREIHIHTGPTNSGKTYHAMQRYLKAKSGIYAAPLRTLAYETYVRANNEGVDCDMFTGEQKIYKNGADSPSAHISCTTEMVPTNLAMYEVAVLDEIQMIADKQRGGAWTRALFGVCCEELHLCGHQSAIEIVKSLLERTGEELTVHSYERLTPLTFQPDHLNSDWSQVRPGDCIISFSRQRLHTNKANIEEKTNMKCSIIYGGLPPSVRLEQIRLFNDPESDYQVAVASDAIGLGVNLNIKRIVFEDLYKMLSNKMTRITPELVKQVSGRAGRFMSIYPEGEVTCFHPNHYHLLKYLFNAKIDEIPKAIISPPPQIWSQLDYLMPNYDMMQLLEFMNMGLSKIYNYEFFVRNDLEKMSLLHKKIGLSSLTSLSLLDCFVSLKKSPVCNMAEHIFTMFAEGRISSYEDLLFICSWPRPPPAYAQSLEEYEHISDLCDLYLWLNQRNPLFFPDRMKVQELKGTISKTIGDTLSRPCINDGLDVLYIPDSDYCENLQQYFKDTVPKSL